ncbi:MAG TPA: HAMP domain-containing sensor histidine kinase [Holophagaceae bacterium]|nr:HAMP domain-containing sensor histidine kinase [Holophagaceae bacterium]
MEAPSRPGPRLPAQAKALALAYLGAGALSLATLPPGLVVASALNLLNSLVFLHAAVAGWRRAGHQPASRAGWRFFSACFTAQVVCQAYPLVFAWRTGRLPEFPSFGDGFALLALTFFVGGLALWPRAAQDRSDPLQKALDGLGIGLSVLFIGWALALEPMFRPPEITRGVKAVTLAFLLGTASVLGLVAYLAVGQWGRLRGTLGWMGAAFLMAFAQILIQVPLGLDGRYYVGHPADLLVLAAGVLLLLGALDPADPADHTGPVRFGILDERLLGIVGPISPSLLCLPVGIACLVFAPSRWDRTLVALGIASFAVIVLRMVLALRDLRSFTLELDQRVQARTRDLEEAQALLLRTERMNALASLGAGLAHDLKNLLGVMKNYALLVGQDLAEGRPIQPGDLEAIQEASDQAGQLANQLMAYGREDAEAGLSFDLRARLKQLISMVRAALPAYISLEVRLPDKALMLPGESTRVDQLIINLVLNARDAIEGSGRILVEAQGCTLATGRPGALLVVSDSGIGMSEEVQARIFEPFFTTKAIGSGTGLGLASVKSIVELMGAEVEVHSVVGRGTTFLLRFPLAETPQEPAPGL